MTLATQFRKTQVTITRVDLTPHIGKPLNKFNAHRVRLSSKSCDVILRSVGAKPLKTALSEHGRDHIFKNINYVFRSAFVTSFGDQVPYAPLVTLERLGRRIQTGRATPRMIESFEVLIKKCQQVSFPPPISERMDWPKFWAWHAEAFENNRGRPEIEDLFTHQMILTLYECIFLKTRSIFPGKSSRFLLAFLKEGRAAIESDFGKYGKPSEDTIYNLSLLWRGHRPDTLSKRWKRAVDGEDDIETGPNGEAPISINTVNCEVTRYFSISKDKKS